MYRLQLSMTAIHQPAVSFRKDEDLTSKPEGSRCTDSAPRWTEFFNLQAYAVLSCAQQKTHPRDGGWVFCLFLDVSDLNQIQVMITRL